MLSTDERRVLSNVDPQEIERILGRAARIPAFSPPTGQEEELAQFFAAELKRAGIDVEVQEVEPRRPNVIGRVKGSGRGKSIAFNGHTDTSPPVLGWTIDPHGGAREGDRLYGHGMSNMKGSDVAMIAAAAALRRSGVPLAGDVSVTLVMGECRGGQGAKYMLEKGFRADFFVNGEPTDLRILTISAGVCPVKITVKGRAHHYSLPGKGVNAIEKMIKILGALGESNTPLPPDGWLPIRYRKPEYEGFPRFNIGVIKAGLTEQCLDWGPYNTPDFCVATIDVRYPPGVSAEHVRDCLRSVIKAVAARDPDVMAEVELLTDGHMVPYEAGPNDFIVRTIQSAAADVLGREVELGAIAPMKFMGADAGAMQAAGIPGVMCGVGTFPGSVAGEYVELSKVIDLTKMYALTAYRVAKEPQSR